ncbi:MAG: hypothetical protein CMG46_09465 [Candidatus Marinimicrobia bacterium]|nr:hypothetical protein [Candidatus Neomarinimicrobiota bacterium]
MNRTKVIVLMTIAVFILLGVLMLLFFGGWPPWPVTLCFTISHVVFCAIVAQVKPFNGPYRRPLVDPDPADWPGGE